MREKPRFNTGPDGERYGHHDDGLLRNEDVEPRKDRQKNKKGGISRRKVLIAGGKAVVGAAVAGKGLHRLIEEVEKEKGESKFFLAEIEKYKLSAQRENTEEKLLEQFNPVEEATLVEKIRSGEVRSTIEVAEHFGNKPVIGAEEFTRIEYVEQEMQFKSSVPPEVQDELRKIMPGLCAQESRFDNNSESMDGANGIFQFMPDTWKELQDECVKEDKVNGIENPEPLNINSLRDQTRAAGKHFSNIHKRLYHYATPELEHIKKTFFPNSGFEKYFLVPLMINSYNAGSKRLGDAIILLASEFKNKEAAEVGFKREIRYLGYDVFLLLSQVADESKEGTLERYGEFASEYFPRLFAQNELLKERAKS